MCGVSRRWVFRLSSFVFRGSFFVALVAATAARAGVNDLQLWRLGHPDDVAVCTRCDGTDRTVEPGDPKAQARFARFASALGLALVPARFDPAATSGQSGFELGFSAQVAIPRKLADGRDAPLDPNEWPTTGTQGTAPAPRTLFVPTLSLRKGLGGSFELGMHASLLAGSQIVGLGASVKWAAIEGLDVPIDLAFVVHGTRVLGTQELDLVSGGADALLSARLAIAGMVKLQPYAQLGLLMLNATSGVVDFKPQTEDVRYPTDDDGVFRTVNFFQNRYLRAVVGVRLIAGVAVIGLEGGYAWGTNPIQHDLLQDGTEPPKQTTRLWSASGRLGLAF